MAVGVQLTVRNPSGLHARPAALFVRTAAAFVANISMRNLSRPGPATDAKSILGVLSLGVRCDHIIEVMADGPDAARAIDVLAELVAGGIGEVAGAG